jgi:hypothetical protein
MGTLKKPLNAEDVMEYRNAIYWFLYSQECFNCNYREARDVLYPKNVCPRCGSDDVVSHRINGEVVDDKIGLIFDLLMALQWEVKKDNRINASNLSEFLGIKIGSWLYEQIRIRVLGNLKAYFENDRFIKDILEDIGIKPGDINDYDKYAVYSCISLTEYKESISLILVSIALHESLVVDFLKAYLKKDGKVKSEINTILRRMGSDHDDYINKSNVENHLRDEYGVDIRREIDDYVLKEYDKQFNEDIRRKIVKYRHRFVHGKQGYKFGKEEGYEAGFLAVVLIDTFNYLHNKYIAK